MGRVLNALTRFRRDRTKQVQSKHVPLRAPGSALDEKFELNHVPLWTPQSALDQRIFYPDWTPKPQWKCHRGVDFVGNPCWIFTSPDDPNLHLDEMQLKLYRHLSFDLKFENGQIVYKHARDPPLECITSPTALENAKPYCIGKYRD
ncbi:hypothetical protein N7540_011058 [Penicillium herquei]|nr:hypothetical protein N7540_011058 [Penicillium herquei]